MKGSGRSSPGFTLLETLISVALLAALLLCLNQFAFSMGELWGHGTERRLFERHASAVTRHLQGMLQEATNGLGADAPVAISDVLAGAGNEMSLCLELPGGNRVFSDLGGIRPAGVTCSVRVESGKGLLLRWESRFAADAAILSGTRILSPFGERMDYEYCDRVTGRWTAADRPARDAEGRWLLPDRLRLHFARGDLRTTRTAYLTRLEAGLPPF